MDFWRFQPPSSNQAVEIIGHFNYPLVVLSVLVAALAAHTSLVVIERTWAKGNRERQNSWLLFGAAVFGFGVWCMHFTGMLAFEIAAPMRYDSALTALSLAPVILGTFATHKILAQRRFDFWSIQRAALALASGIVGMHLIGMEAMQLGSDERPVALHYDLPSFIAAIVIAQLLATLALKLRIQIKSRESSGRLSRVFSALGIGAVISGIHYSAMQSAIFYTSPEATLATTAAHSHDAGPLLPLAVITMAVLVLAIAAVGATIDRRLQESQSRTQQLENRSKAILENMADAILVVSEPGLIVDINRAGLEMFGYPANSELTGKKLRYLIPEIRRDNLPDTAFPEDARFVSPVMELQGRRQDKSCFPVEARYTKILDNQDDAIFYVVVRDISERKALQSKLQQAKKLESIGRLAAGIAHEINSPAQFIGDNIRFLADAFPDLHGALKAIAEQLENQSNNANNKTTIDATVHEQLQAALDASDFDYLGEEIPKCIADSLEGLERIAEIVRAMKSFTRPASLNKQDTDLPQLIESTVTVAKHQWSGCAELDCEFAADLPLVPCVSSEIGEVLLNIVSNAALAIKDAAEQSEQSFAGQIAIASRVDGDNAIITVSDNGIGMSADVATQAFDPFFTTREVGQGSGQGLAIAYNIIVEKHDGQLSVESKPGQGSTFTIKLPLGQASAAQVDGPPHLAVA